ncbi:MAG: hypothetical protein HFE63_04845 [Clostridiales bacterium]|nr:hypothetical protein [Clostridiales bacterium]
MFRSKKNLYTILVIIGVPAIIIIVSLASTLFLTLNVDFVPDELPDRIVLTSTIRRGKIPIKSQRVEIVDTDEIARLIGCFDSIIICGVGQPLRTRFTRDYEEIPYRKITFEYESGVSFYYNFDSYYIERSGETFRIVGHPLDELIRIIDNSAIITE